MGEQLDELAKALAGGMSRRRASLRFVSRSVGSALARLGPRGASAQSRSSGGHGSNGVTTSRAPLEGWERDGRTARSAKCRPGYRPVTINGGAFLTVNGGDPICVPV